MANALDLNFPSKTERRLLLRVAAIACIASCCLVLLDLWGNRDLFDPEGITFLDMADAYRHGHSRAALIGGWSPLYPWLLSLMMFVFNPSGQWEFTAVHALNFFIYLVTLTSFSVFMWEFLWANKDPAANGRLPDWSWLVFGYSLFTWASIRLMPPHLPEPDSIVCALVYLILAMLFRIRRRAVTWGESIFLGLLLGVGYLAKAVMFPMAFVFIGVALMLGGRSAKNLYKIVVAFSVFLLLSLPYIVVLSNANSRWMFSDAGRLDYTWATNQVKKYSHWQGEEIVHGTPVHPTRKIYDDPPMYEFGEPFHVTYPPWYNPSYWYEGVKVPLDLRRQLSVIVRNAKALLLFLATSPTASANWYGLESGTGRTIGPFLTLLCVMVLRNEGRVSLFRRIVEHWFVLVPIGSALGAYALLHFEGRYIAAYVVVLWTVLFRSVAISHSAESKKILTAVLVAASLVTIITVAVATGRAVFLATRDFAIADTKAHFLQSGYTNWQVAKYLQDAGLREGDPVGSVGWTYRAYWARMARVHIVAEVPEEPRGAKMFWSWNREKTEAIMQLFRNVGAKAVVANERAPDDSPQVTDSAQNIWQRIGDTDYYVYVFTTQ